MKSKIIQQGAEAVISLEPSPNREGGRTFARDKLESTTSGSASRDKNHQVVLKNRISKGYRLPVLDQKLRKLRTRSEAKIINKLSGIIPVPKIIDSNEKTFQIEMEYIQGEKLSISLENLDYKQICKQIANLLTKLHNQDIVHGDLTTSNMIYVENNTSNSERYKEKVKFGKARDSGSDVVSDTKKKRKVNVIK